MFSLYSMWLIFRMRELGENEALLVKQVDSRMKCTGAGAGAGAGPGLNWMPL